MMCRLYDASSASMRISPGATSLIERNHVSSSTEPSCCGNVSCSARVEPAPERPRAADEVLPQPRLRLVQAERRAAREQRALERRVDAGLVQAVAALVHRREEPVERVLRLARRDADVLRRERLRERVRRRRRAASAVSSKPKRFTISSESCRWIVRREGAVHLRRRAGAAASTSGISTSFSRSKIARTSAAFIPCS